MKEMTKAQLDKRMADGIIECETDISRSGNVEVRYCKSKKRLTIHITDHVPVVDAQPVEVEEVKEGKAEEREADAETPKAAVEKKSKVSKRPYIEDVKGWLEAGSHSRKEIIEQVLAKFPQVSKGGIQTFTTDLKNPRYCHFAPREVVEKDGKLIFADVLVKRAEQAGVVQAATEPEATDQAE